MKTLFEEKSAQHIVCCVDPSHRASRLTLSAFHTADALCLFLFKPVSDVPCISIFDLEKLLLASQIEIGPVGNEGGNIGGELLTVA